MMISLPAQKLAALSQTTYDQGELLGKGVLSDSGDNSGSSSSHSPGSTPLQASRESQDLVHKSNQIKSQARFLVRPNHPNSSQCQVTLALGIEQVNAFNGQPLQIPSWDRTIYRSRNLHGGMGSLLSRTENWRSMDCTRAVASYQFSKIDSCLPGLTIFLLGQQGHCCPPSTGQCISHFLPEQDGGESLPTPFRPIYPDLGVVHQEEHLYSCRTPTRSAECPSRLEKLPNEGFQ